MLDVKCILGHLQDLERLGDFIKKLAEQFVLFLDPAEKKKVNKHFKIWRQFQYSMTHPNDIIHTKNSLAKQKTDAKSLLC